MQTFVPYADFARSAAVLDDKRLGKQRVETLQVMPLTGARVTGSSPVVAGTTRPGILEPCPPPPMPPMSMSSTSAAATAARG